ncbi:NAD dependent epimerase/dehydratase family protein [Byssothecium circinans]|uniref:NAD dependent epimerase/dehydratase family protein n=1 Tax=Byssothecium circinans TaxID=147558 RepID=A0A6A5TBY9_9PLEO|nr:NAD dependent epimerase/dehydratase family protein [Byssothecium circinans]
MPSAIVTGATGILGREIVFELSRSPQKWPTVHALSRSKKENYPSSVVHNHIDLTTSASDMAKDLQNVRGEYIFFAAYLAQDTEQKAWDVNGAMLTNFLDALVQTGAIKDVKRIILVTGAKQYGVHLGVPKNPMLEDDEWLEDPQWPPNFYYNQQHTLHKFCAQHAKEWVVTYPNDVIGFAEGNFMNLSLALALYAVVTKELGQDLVFPGSPAFYAKFDCFTESKLHAQFCAWAALEPRAANQAFNVVNGDMESWQNLWPKVAKYFGLGIKPDQFSSSTIEKENSSEAPLQDPPPISAFAAKCGLQGHPITRTSKLEQQIDLVKWSQRDDVKRAWKKVAEREGLREEVFDKATWGFLGFVLGRAFDLVISMSKARRAGWTGYRDTWESLEGVFGELRGEGVIPK